MIYICRKSDNIYQYDIRAYLRNKYLWKFSVYWHSQYMRKQDLFILLKLDLVVSCDVFLYILDQFSYSFICMQHLK